MPYRRGVTVKNVLRLVADLEAIGGDRPPRPGYGLCPWEGLGGRPRTESKYVGASEPNGSYITEHINWMIMIKGRTKLARDYIPFGYVRHSSGLPVSFLYAGRPSAAPSVSEITIQHPILPYHQYKPDAAVA